MTKQTKMIIAVGAVALGGYLLYKRSKSFANLTAPMGLGGMVGCQNGCKQVVAILKTEPDGTTWKQCKGGQACCYGSDGVAGSGNCPKNIELSKPA